MAKFTCCIYDGLPPIVTKKFNKIENVWEFCLKQKYHPVRITIHEIYDDRISWDTNFIDLQSLKDWVAGLVDDNGDALT